MAITTDDFNKIWASTSPLTPYSFSESKYKEGWNFIGSTPPSRQMWDFLQKNNDEKMQYLLNHFDNYLPLSGGTLTGVVNGVTPPNGDNSKKLATTEFVTATAQQADWNVTDTTSKAFVKNKPLNLKNIGNENAINLYSFFKDDNAANPVYMLMQELTSYSPDSYTFPTPTSYGFNGIVYGKLRKGNGHNQLMALVTVNLGYEYDFLYSSSDHYRPVVVKDEASNKYYWAMRTEGSYQDVIMFGQFTKAPLFTKIMATDKQGTLPSGWSLIHDAKTYELTRTIVAKAVSDRNGARIDTTYLKKEDAQLLPVGVVQAFAGSTTPQGWLLCDGSAVSRTDYAALYAVIGTTYGSGNGSTTFNLPNLVDKFVEGSATAGIVKNAGLPNITGNMKDFFTWNPGGSGAITVSNFEAQAARGTANGNFWQFDFDASKSNAIYGNSTTVQPPALTMRYIIKY